MHRSNRFVPLGLALAPRVALAREGIAPLAFLTQLSKYSAQRTWLHYPGDWDKSLVMSCWEEEFIDLVQNLSSSDHIHATVAAVHWGGECDPDSSDDSCSFSNSSGMRTEGSGSAAMFAASSVFLNLPC